MLLNNLVMLCQKIILDVYICTWVENLSGAEGHLTNHFLYKSPLVRTVDTDVHAHAAEMP